MELTHLGSLRRVCDVVVKLNSIREIRDVLGIETIFADGG